MIIRNFFENGIEKKNEMKRRWNEKKNRGWINNNKKKASVSYIFIKLDQMG